MGLVYIYLDEWLMFMVNDDKCREDIPYIDVMGLIQVIYSGSSRANTIEREN